MAFVALGPSPSCWAVGHRQIRCKCAPSPGDLSLPNHEKEEAFQTPTTQSKAGFPKRRKLRVGARPLNSPRLAPLREEGHLWRDALALHMVWLLCLEVES